MIPLPLKKFNIVVGQTDAEGSPPPPPAPSGPVSSQERFISDGTYCPGDAYSSGPIAYSNQGAQAYYTKRYSSETGTGLPRYNSSYQHVYSSIPQQNTAELPSYYSSRYPDYTRYQNYTTAATAEATSPGWRRRSYDPDVDYGLGSRRMTSVNSSFGRPLTDLTVGTGQVSVSAGNPSGLSITRSRSRSRVPTGDIDTSYMRYVPQPSGIMHTTSAGQVTSSMRPASGSSTLSNRPMSSGYLYGHAASMYAGFHWPQTSDQVPNPPPPGYGLRSEREVSARIRRYQPPES